LLLYSAAVTEEAKVALIDAWRVPEAAEFFRNVWPMYVHELSAFDSDFYALDARGRWQPDIVEDWLASATPPANLREPRAAADPAQPFQRTHVITSGERPAGFICVGTQPLKYMPEDADLIIAELFLVHASRGTGVGRRALALLLGRHPGRWHLQVIHDNARAIRFWEQTLPALGVQELAPSRDGLDVTFRFVVAR
jgi:predicted acetyltransferase